jgi:hypothetical protein
MSQSPLALIDLPVNIVYPHTDIAPPGSGIPNSSFTPITNTYTTGSGNESVPTNASQLIAECWAGGGAGSIDGGTLGGGGAGYSKITIAISSSDWLKNIPYVVGAGGIPDTNNGQNSTVGSILLVAGTLNLTAHGGTSGGGSVSGTGGTASGGDTNTTGENGLSSNYGGACLGAEGGARQTAAGNVGNIIGGGGYGVGGTGARGQVKFAWT